MIQSSSSSSSPKDKRLEFFIDLISTFFAKIDFDLASLFLTSVELFLVDWNACIFLSSELELGFLNIILLGSSDSFLNSFSKKTKQMSIDKIISF